MDLFILKLTSRWRRMVILMIQPLYPRKKLHFSFGQKEVWVGRSTIPYPLQDGLIFSVPYIGTSRHDSSTIRLVPVYTVMPNDEKV